MHVSMIKSHAHDQPLSWPRLVLRVVGAGLLVTTAAIHLDLYLTGYRSIPTIGWLFLLQAIVAVLLGAAVVALGDRVAAAAGGVFAMATMGGYLLSLHMSLFGFREVRTTAGITAGIVEIAAFVLLATLVLLPDGQDAPAGGQWWADRLLGMLPATTRITAPAAAIVSVAAVVLLSVFLVDAGPTGASPSASSGALLDATTIGGSSVLTNSRGLTLYWFVPDTPTKSTCYGTCATYWPPVICHPSAGAGVHGHLGTVTRSDGSTQTTYDGHPLYTYVGDSAPGQAHGNDIDLNGGVWHEMTETGSIR